MHRAIVVSIYTMSPGMAPDIRRTEKKLLTPRRYRKLLRIGLPRSDRCARTETVDCGDVPSGSEFELSVATAIDKAIRIALGASMRYNLP